MARSGAGRSRVEGLHYTGWVRIRPRLGREQEFARLAASSPHLVFEAWRFEDELMFYGWLYGVAVPRLRLYASVEPVEEPPGLERFRWMAELKAPRHDTWETGVGVAEWKSVYAQMPPGMVLQVIAHYDAYAELELRKKATHYRLGRKPEMRGMGPLEYHRQDPARAREIERLLASPERRRIMVTLVRVYGGDKEAVRLFADAVSGFFTPALKVVVKRRRGKSSELRDWEQLLTGVFSKKGRKDLPWIPWDEFVKILELPRPEEAPVKPSRAVPLPSVVPERPREESIRVGETPDGKEVWISLEDLYRHGYVVGMTGGGKSTFLWNLVLRLHGLGKAAIVVIDPHGELAYDLLQSSLERDRVWFLDPIRAPFGLNPLEVPDIPGFPREHLFDMVVKNTVEMLEKIMRLPETAVNVKYLVQTLLRYMLEKMENPTLGDLYEAVMALRSGELDLPIDDPKWRLQVEILQKMQEQTFISALSRLEPFARSPVVRRVTSRTTLDLRELLRPGNLVVVRLAKGELTGEVVELLMAILVQKLWFYVLERDARIRSGAREEKTPIIAVIDEFQNAAGAEVFEDILSEARKYGLHLVLAHQYVRQVPDGLLHAVLANTGFKLVFPPSGEDIEKFARVDAAFAEQLRKALSGISPGEAVLFLRSRPGEEAPPPIIVRTDPPPRRPRSGPPEKLARTPTPPPEEPEASDIVAKLNPVLRYLPRDRLDPVEAWVLYHTYILSGQSGDGWVQWSDVNVRLGLPRKKADEARDRLAARGFIEATKQGNRWLVRYVKGLFDGLRAAAPGDEGYRLAREALLYYFQRGFIVYSARQDPGLPSRPDLVAIPWDPSSMSLRYDKAVAVEVESCNELETHPEQVIRNLLKHRGVFAEVHFWAPAGCRRRLVELLERAKPRLPLPVKIMPEEPRGAVEEAGAGEAVEEQPEPGSAEEEPKAPREESEKIHEEHRAKAEISGAGAATAEDLHRLLEAQARHLLALGEAVTSILEAQKTSQEKLQQLLEAITQTNKLLEQQTKLLERLLQHQEYMHRDNEEPIQEPTHSHEEPQRAQTETPEETREPEPEQPGQQTCIPVELDHPQGETTCLPPETAHRAQQLRKQGYKLIRTRTGKLYATRGTRKLALE